MAEGDPYAEVSMGTTNFALKYAGGVLIASDSRTSRGTFIEDRNAHKMIDISPATDVFGGVWVVRAGTAAHTQMLTRYAHDYLCFHAMELAEGQPLRLRTVATLFQAMVYPNKNALSVGLLLTNGREVLSVHRSGAVFEHALFAAQGSGSLYVDALLKSRAREGLSLAEAEQIAREALAYSVDTDAASGGNLVLVDVREDGSSTKKIVFNAELRATLAHA